MSLLADELERPSDSPLVDVVMAGRTEQHGVTIRPAENQWHMCLVKHNGAIQQLITGPLTTTGIVHFIPGVELLWIRFKVGAFLPHMPFKGLLDTEAGLPAGGGQNFWLKGSTWQFPTYENADTFVDRLVRAEVIATDPVVTAALRDDTPALPDRTLRHRFLRATGLSQSVVRQIERAKHAAALLRRGVSILDTVHEAGYFDQPHLTRALKQWIGHTPAQIIQMTQPACQQPGDTLTQPTRLELVSAPT
jgi:hypothetical protein